MTGSVRWPTLLAVIAVSAVVSAALAAGATVALVKRGPKGEPGASVTYSRATAKRRDAQARPEPTSTPTPAATAAPADSSAADVDKLEAMDEDLTDAVCAALQAAIDVEEYDSRRQHAIRAAGPLGCSIVIG